MAGRQTFRMVVAGVSGAGKTEYVRKMIRKLARERRFSKLVIVNRKRDLAQFAEAAYKVDEDGDPAAALARHDRVFFQVRGYDPRPFLDKLGLALQNERDVLLVVDEAFQFFPRGRVPKALFSIITEGREAGVNMIFATQMLKSAGGGIDLGVLQQATHLVAFRLQGNDVSRVEEYFPELGERVTRLKRPADDGLPPEFAIKDLMLDRAVAVLRDPQDPKKYRELDITRDTSGTAFELDQTPPAATP